MNGDRFLVLDTNILIYLSKGEIDFESLVSVYDKFFISVISYMEVMGFKFETEDEKNTIEKLLLSFEIIQTDMEIAKLVINYRLENKIKIPDAIILATAKKLKADLVTRNTDDFINVDKSVTLSNI